MTEQELQKYVEDLSIQFFGRPFLHKAIFNPRLKTTGGRYHLTDHHLDFNPYMLAQHGEDVFMGIVKHELCHYHLHLTGQGHRHRDPAFKALLAKTGGLRYAPASASAANYRYQCQSCQTLFERRKRIDTNRYVCGKCKGPLIKIGNNEKSQAPK
ncbi:SprT family protein [Enterococcus sp. DIV0876]|uniref:SprT family protein n=1 Tax=Enterococcus sp. DIV0876 TaxID=2774633 RepID=UPI003D2FBD21